MKLLRVIHTIAPQSGGPIEGLKQSSRIMTELGVTVEIASPDCPEAIQAEAQSLPWQVHALGPGRFGSYGYSKKLRTWLSAHVCDYDAVIIHGNWQHHGLATANACIQHNVPYFIFPHGMLDPWFNETYPLKKIKKQLYWSYEYKVLKHAAAVLFTCAEECRLARKSFSPYAVTEQVAGYGTTVPELNREELIRQFQSDTPTWGQKPFLLFMSRIQEKKGLDLLVEAYSELRKSNPNTPALVIAGPEQQPEYADRIRSQFDQSGIHWIGSLSGIDKWKTLAASEALVLPSHQENFGLVVAEALAVGTPTLISNKVNIWNEIQSGNAGLVQDDTLAGTEALLKTWHSLSAEQRSAMSQAALDVFKAHFDISESTKRLVDSIQTHIN